MNNVETKLTKENEYLKEFILQNYEHSDISICYGSFYTSKGWFALGQKRYVEPAEYCFVFSSFGKTQTKNMFDYKDEKVLKECMEMVGIEPIKQKIETKSEKIKGVQTSIFDFGW